MVFTQVYPNDFLVFLKKILIILKTHFEKKTHVFFSFQLMSEFGVWISVAIFVTIAIQLLLVYLSCQISTKHQAGNSFMFSSRVKDEKE